MIGKNNHKLFMEKGANKYKRYTLKKLSVGVVSVSIGFGLMFGSVEGVSADELTGTNSVVEPNNIDSLQFNEEVSDESNIDKLSETVQSESSEQAVAIDQSLEMKRQEVKTILGQSNIVGEQYTDLVTKIANAQTLDELERILAEIKQTASLEDNQDESKQSETEHDAEEKLKNNSEDKAGELDKITPPSTETSLPKEASVENLAEVDQLNVTSDVKYTLNDVRHLLNAADIARIESGELTVQQMIEKLLNNKVELRETEVRYENGVLAAGVEKSSLSTDNQRGKSRSRRSLNNINVDLLFQPFTEQDTVRDVYARIQQMRDAKLIAETELHFLQIEILRHLRNDIANNEQDSNNLTPKNGGSKLPTDERILNMNLSKQADVTIPMSRLGGAYNQVINENKKELDYVNELLQNIQSVLLGRFGVNDEGVYFSSDEYYNGATTYGSHKTRKTFHAPVLTSNPNGTITLKMSSENEGGVELKNHYAFSFHINPELNERIKEHETVEGVYRPENGQQSDENGDKLQNPVGSPIFETNHYPAQNGVFPENVGYYMSEWSTKEGYDKKKDKFAKIELVFEANDQPIQKAQISSSILSSSFNYRHRSGTFIATQAFNEKAEELKTLLNLMTEYKQLKNKITGTKQKIDEFDQNLGEPTRVLSQRDYDTLNATRQELMREIDKIKNDYSTLTEKSMYNNLHQQLKTDISTLKSTVETPLKNLYSVNDLNNNGKKDDQDVNNAVQKVSDAKNRKITLLSKVTELTGRPDISQEEYLQAVSLSNQFKTSIEEARLAIDEIPESDIISSLNISYNEKRTQLKSDLPQDDVQLPSAPTTATQTSSDPNEKNSITNPTLINGDFSDLTLGAVVGSAENGPDSVPGWTVVNSSQTKIPLVNRRHTSTGTTGPFANNNRNNAVVVGASNNRHISNSNQTGKVNVDAIGGIHQEIDVTPGSELVVKYRSDTSGSLTGIDQAFNGANHARAQAQVVVTRVDTNEKLMELLPPSRGYGETAGVVSIPRDVTRVRVTLLHKSDRVHNDQQGVLSQDGWYPGAVVSDVRVSSGSHVTTEIVNQSQTYTPSNNTSSPYNGKVQVRFHNNGHEKANATFTMRLPEGVTYRSVSNGSGSYNEQSRTLTVTKNGIPAKISNQDTYTTVDINLTFNTETPRTFEIETQNVTYHTSPDHLNAVNTGRNITLGNAGSYSVTVSMYTSELQSKVNEYQATTQSYKYYNAPDDLKSKYDSVIEEGRQILENPQSTQQAINDIANKIGTAKDALNGGETNKDELQAAINEADNTISDPFYSRLQDIDSNLKSEYDQAIAEAQQILGEQDATQKEVKQATDKLSLQAIKVALKKYEESIETYRESYDQLPKLDNDQIFVTGKANRQLAQLWSEINKSRISAWNKVYQNNIKQNLQPDFFKIDMKRRKLVEVPDKTEISIPTEKISVHDLGANLSIEEKNIIKKAIEDTNNFLSGTKVEISDNGTATITFPDHTESEPSQETIDRSELIRELTPGEKQLLLEKRKEKALDEINQLEELTDDEKATYEADINEAETLEEVEGYVENAKEIESDKAEAGDELAEAKAKALDEINQLEELTDDEKATYEADINEAETLEEVEGYVENAKEIESDKAEAGDELAEAKAKALDEINQLEELTDDEKATYEADINEAETLEEVEGYVENAKEIESDKAEAGDELAEAKAKALDEINQLEELTDDEKATYEADINEAETLEEVEGYVENAKEIESDKAEAGDELAEAKRKHELNKFPDTTSIPSIHLVLRRASIPSHHHFHPN
ncbi:SasC/FmtB family protein [Dolosigranulum pigrum]|uniref:YSIRK-type signal peptide-containing protein n=1 Tax=Dolosigranulum pigrum TaxID=29394 RepID=A0A516GHP3_9LACT|nr:SasC/FmtB family protein [Dolosigranulum pigrum]QDO91029.1 YSIRK-type signal peptide-containing protein [Dolosigranulum pigrum]